MWAQLPGLVKGLIYLAGLVVAAFVGGMTFQQLAGDIKSLPPKVTNLEERVSNLEAQNESLAGLISSLGAKQFVLYSDSAQLIGADGASSIRWSSPDKAVLRRLEETFAVKSAADDATTFKFRKVE